jgi:hypothetical protein
MKFIDRYSAKIKSRSCSYDKFNKLYLLGNKVFLALFNLLKIMID